MKKPLLLLLSGLAGASSLMAGNPTIYENAVFQALSPDNRYVASNYYGQLDIYDLVSGKTYSYYSDEGYSLPNGNGFSATGVLVGGISSDKGACYWKDGEWHELPVLDESRTNIAGGITKDGTRICGNLGMHEMSLDAEIIMQTPYYWDLQEDGTYSAPKPLPYPEKDFSGRTPQYITATCISDDGKTILGQIMDYSGQASCEAIIYTQNESGEWSYNLPTRSIINPDNVALPEDPGESPAQPNPSSFMTQEEIDAYNTALNDYFAGTSDDYPEYTNFMSPEKKAEYDAAMEVYNTEFMEWQNKFDTYNDAFWTLVEANPIFQFNSVAISGNGRYIVLNGQKEDPNGDPMSWMPSYIYTPMRLDLTTNELVKYTGAKDTYSDQVFDDGRVVVKSILSVLPVETYISDASTSDLTPIVNYIEAKQPTLAAWMRDNMTHTVEEYVIDEDGDYAIVDNEYFMPGRGIISSDEKLFVSWTENQWDFESEAWYYGYVFDLTQPVAGVSNVAVEDNALTVKVDAEGTIYLGGKAAKLEIFDLNGRCVRTWDNPSAATNTLLNGLYIVKATAENGTSTVVKAAL